MKIEPIICYKVQGELKLVKFLSKDFVGKKLMYNIDRIYNNIINSFKLYHILDDNKILSCFNSIKSMIYEYLRKELNILEDINIIEKTKDLINFKFNDYDNYCEIILQIITCDNTIIPNTSQIINAYLYLYKNKEFGDHKIKYDRLRPRTLPKGYIELKRKISIRHLRQKTEEIETPIINETNIPNSDKGRDIAHEEEIIYKNEKTKYIELYMTEFKSIRVFLDMYLYKKYINDNIISIINMKYEQVKNSCTAETFYSVLRTTILNKIKIILSEYIDSIDLNKISEIMTFNFIEEQDSNTIEISIKLFNNKCRKANHRFKEYKINISILNSLISQSMDGVSIKTEEKDIYTNDDMKLIINGKQMLNELTKYNTQRIQKSLRNKRDKLLLKYVRHN